MKTSYKTHHKPPLTLSLIAADFSLLSCHSWYKCVFALKATLLAAVIASPVSLVVCGGV